MRTPYERRQGTRLPISFRLASAAGRLPYFRGRDRVGMSLARLAARGGAITSEAGGVTLALHPDDWSEAAILRTRTLPTSMPRIVQRLVEPGMTVVDVGANIGWIAILAAQATGPDGTVVALEPHAETFRRLKANIALNHVPWLHAEQVACGSTQGSATLYSSREASVYSSLQPCIRDITNQSEAVKMVRLDTYFKEHALPTPHVVKIDVEGAEWDVLRGMECALRSTVPKIFIELSAENSSRFGYHPAELIAWLAQMGYQVRSLGGDEIDLALSEDGSIDALATHVNQDLRRPQARQ